MAEILVGTIVQLKMECLGNPVGAKGVCYEVYNIGHRGVSIIFANGNYDGFSPDEQEKILMVIGFCESVSGYQFKSVMQLYRDFRYSNIFKPIK